MTKLFALIFASIALLVDGCTTSGNQSDKTPAEARGKKPRSIVLTDEPFKCADYPQPLNLNLVKVKMTRSARSRISDAIWLSGGDCSGIIRRIEVDTWLEDGLKIGRQAHDLTIHEGLIRCHGRLPKAHQDGIHVMGGKRIALRNIEVDCRTSNHSAFYVNQGKHSTTLPSDVVCESCLLRATGTTVHIANSERSGVRDSTIYAGEYFNGVRICECAVDPVSGNKVIAP